MKNGIITIISTISLILIILVIFPQTNSTNEINEINFQLQFDIPKVSKFFNYNQEFDRVNLDDCKIYSKPGSPCIPVKPLRILLPYSSYIDSIEIITNEQKIVDEKISNIEIGEYSYILNDPPSIKSAPVASYDEDKLYPKEIFNKIGVQNYRGFSILHINLHPVQFNSSSQSILYYTEMNVIIKTRQSIHQDLYRGLKKDKEHIVNNVDFIDDSVIQTYTYSHNKPIVDESTYEYVIITTDEFKNYQGSNDFSDLINQRKNQGISATIITVEQIYNEFSGKDEAEKIRNFIKYAYMNWSTDWILLAGDVEYVPVRLLWDIDGADIGMASDIYYQCLDGDYNHDNDSWYGEKKDGINGGLIDLYAEVYIGRASVDCFEEIDNFVRKTIQYESYEWGIDNHLVNVDSVGEYVWSGLGGWGAGYVERCIGYCSDYKHETYGINPSQYSIQNRYERDSKYSEIELLRDINNGLNFINHLGHSSPTYCMRFSPDEIFEFTNTKYGFWYSQGCHPGQLQAADECVSEAWTVAENGGFAAIMNTGYGYGAGGSYDGPDNRFAREFWDALNNSEEKISRIGKANQDSKEDNIWRIDDGNHMYHNYYSTNLFGDPYVQMKGMEDFRADFFWNPSYPTPNNPVYFYDNSLSAIKYNWNFGDGSNSEEKNPNHTYENEGTYSVKLTITGSDNKKDEITRYIQIYNNWPPIPVPNPKIISTDIPTITFQAEDSYDPDGIVTSYYWDFGDGFTSDEISPTHTFTSDGIYNVTLTVTDDKGKSGSTICDIRIDQNTPPETELIVIGERGENNWIIGQASVSIQSSDWSDIKRIKYSFDEETWHTYIDPFTVNENGMHSIYYYAEDIWGNIETIKEKNFNIDTIKPKLEVSFEGEKINYWYINPVKITCEGQDFESGINNIYYKISEIHTNWKIYNQPITIDQDGIFHISIYCKDNAGLNSDKNQVYILSIDQNPPVTDCIISGDPSPGGIIQISLNSEDFGSGVKKIYYSLDNNEFETYTGQISITKDGDHKISYYAIDQIGNKESIKEKEFELGINPSIDLLYPTNGLYINNDPVLTLKDKIICIGSIDIKASYSPSFLSLKHISFYINDNLVETISKQPFTFTWDEISFGSYDVKIKATFYENTIEETYKIIKFL